MQIKILNFREYEIECLSYVDSSHDRRTNLCDFTIGMMGEITEFISECFLYNSNKSDDRLIKIALEGGDFLWYITMLAYHLGINFNSEDLFKDLKIVEPSTNLYIDFCIEAGKISETLKHYLFNNEVIDTDLLIKNILNTLNIFFSLCKSYNLDIYIIASLNSYKLFYRFNSEGQVCFSSNRTFSRKILDYEFAATEQYKSLVKLLLA